MDGRRGPGNEWGFVVAPDYTGGVAEQLSEKLAEARSAPSITMAANWFGDNEVVLDDVRDNPEATPVRSEPPITLPGWMTQDYAALPLYAVEAVMGQYPAAFADVPDPEAVTNLRAGLVDVGRVVIDHDRRCGVSAAEAKWSFDRTLQYAYAMKAAEVSS